MEGESDSGLPFEYDEQFKQDLRKIDSSDPRKSEKLINRCEAIRRKPFKGEWKSWAMDGLYGLHADPLVILYQLEPNIAPNNDSSMIKRVYFWRIVHHDKQQTAVKNLNIGESQSKAKISLYYEDTPDLQSYVSQLYGSDIVLVTDDNYDGRGVTIQCDIVDTESAEEEIRKILPDAAEVAISRPTVSDVLE